MAGKGFACHAVHAILVGLSRPGSPRVRNRQAGHTYVARHWNGNSLGRLRMRIIRVGTLSWRSDSHRCLDVDVLQPLQFLHPEKAGVRKYVREVKTNQTKAPIGRGATRDPAQGRSHRKDE